MLDRQAYILVHVEGDDILEGNLSVAVHTDEFIVRIDGGGTGRQTQDKGFIGNSGFGLDGGNNVAGGPDGRLAFGLSDNNFHITSVFNFVEYFMKRGEGFGHTGLVIDGDGTVCTQGGHF